MSWCGTPNRLHGQIVEDTRDYFAQDVHGNVWYFGEQTAQYANGLPVGVEGAWQAGVNGAKPGIVMPAPFAVGPTYRQEFSLGVAEDMARNATVHQHVKVPFGAFDDTVETFEFSRLELEFDREQVLCVRRGPGADDRPPDGRARRADQRHPSLAPAGHGCPEP